jgi:hypothetical protein
MIPRKPLPQPAQAHLKDGPPATVSAAPGPESSATAHSQDVPPEQEKKETVIEDSASSTKQSIPDGEGLREKRQTPSRGFLASVTGGSLGSTVSRHLDNFLPPHKKYLNNRISRRTLLLIIGATFILLLALVIGLAVGLSSKSKYVAFAQP